jgi:hypothetical protein
MWLSWRVDALQVRGAGSLAGPLTLEPRVWYNPQLRSTLFLVPGLIAYIAMITAVISTALAVVREKERGTMEQIRCRPSARPTTASSDFVLSLVIARRGRGVDGVRPAGTWLVGALSAGVAVPRQVFPPG